MDLSDILYLFVLLAILSFFLAHKKIDRTTFSGYAMGKLTFRFYPLILLLGIFLYCLNFYESLGKFVILPLGVLSILIFLDRKI